MAGLYGLSSNSHETSQQSFSDWIFKALSTLNDRNAQLFVCALWGNEVLWKNCHKNAEMVVRLAKDSPHEWLDVSKFRLHQTSNGRAGVSSISWSKPPSSVMKCNIDMAMFDSAGMMDFGMILRNEFGQFVACRSNTRQGIFDVSEGEAFGLLEALSWIRDWSSSHYF